jgi:hypothetical protein
MTRIMNPTPLRAGQAAQSHSVEDLIKTLVRDGTTPSTGVVVRHAVSIAEDDSGGDPYNHTGRFRKIFK